MRPLPQLTPANEWFWTSGADGRLRVQGCDDCDALVHPPVPICPACRSRAWEPREVSGRATVVGFTVNHHQWLPGFEPPYVIANVALDEDPSVRLTTNIVGCEPDDVHIGQRGRGPLRAARGRVAPAVRADRRAPTTVDLVGEPQLPAPRPPLSDDRFEHRAVLSGIGRSAIGRRLHASTRCRSPSTPASRRSPTPASTLDDIDGLSTYPGAAGMGMSEGGVTAVEEALRLHPTWINGGGELPGPGGSVIAAMLAVASGLCRHVLCFRTVWESTFATLAPRPAAAAAACPGPHAEWRAPFGAHVGGQLDRHERQPVPAPLRRHPRDARLDRAQRPRQRRPQPGRDLPRPDDDGRLPVGPARSPARSASTTATCRATRRSPSSSPTRRSPATCPSRRCGSRRSAPRSSSGSRGTRARSPTSPRCSARPPTSGRAPSLRPADVDLALVYDGFTFNAISWLEGLGFCGFGEAKDWLDGGRRIALDGELPVNPHGGQLSEGRTHGFGFLYEAMAQLRHEAGERQVADARTAVVTSGGGTPSGVLLLQRDGA